MTPENFARLEAWFEEASNLQGPERTRVYRVALETDPQLAEELRRMLSAYDGETLTPKPDAKPATPPQSPERNYGPWHVERLVGRGGMGAVYLARRVDGQYEREVALKVLAPHLVDETFRERFLAERRILAMLDHPNIAHMLDAGVAEDGSPFLVMEYVDGEDILTYANRRGLSPEDRVRLFLQVNAAVGYAHERLVLHRDLKPSNILVTGAGAVRLLDFGAAKLLTNSGEGLTMTGFTLMTPRYASPEQMRQQPTGTASEVYSLGVVLYEMLSGIGPFGAAQTPLDEFLRLAENRSPAPLGETLGDGAGARCGMTDAALAKKLSGDLRQILSKCLRPDPADRYGTTGALAADLQAWLDNRPVSARPFTLRYQTAKFVRRNRGKLALAALALTLVAAGVAGTIWQSRLAQRRFQDVRALARYQIFDLFDGLMAFEGTGALRQNVVERSLAYLDTLSRDAGRDPGLREEIAAGYVRLGDLFSNAGVNDPRRRERAVQAYAKGREMAQSVPTAAARRTLAMAELGAAAVQLNVPRDQVEAASHRAIQAAEEAIRVSPRDPSNYVSLANTLTQSDQMLRSAGGMLDGQTQGLANFERALGAYQIAQRLGRDPDEIKRLIWNLYNRQAFVLSSTNPRLAIGFVQTALAEIERAPAELRRDARVIRIQASLESSQAWAGGQSKQYDVARGAAARSAQLYQKLLDADPGNLRVMYDLSGIDRTLGIVEGYAGNSRGAADAFEKAVALHSAILEKGPNTQSQFLRAEMQARISEHWSKLGEHAKALAKARAAEADLRILCDVPKPSPAQLMYLARMLTENNLVLNAPDALRYARLAQQLRPGTLADETLAEALIANGQLEEADKLLAPLEAEAAKVDAGKESQHAAALRSLRDSLNRRRAGH